MRMLLTFLLASATLNASASMLDVPQDETQLLVFRTTGEVNLFYQDQIDSIVMSYYDADSIRYGTYVSQAFYTSDSVYLIPLSEIDSVAFGSRNVIEYKPDVRILTDDSDLGWIIRCEENIVFYRLDTPADVLPSVGQKVYYDGGSDPLSYGLCGRVAAVVHEASEVAVVVEDAALSDIFSRYFMAGSVSSSALQQMPALLRQEGGSTIRLTPGFSIGEFGEYSGVASLVYAPASIVVHPLAGYYSFEWDLDLTIESTISVKADESCDYNGEVSLLQIPLSAGPLIPRIEIGFFVDFNAELSFSQTMRRHYVRHFQWQRTRGKEDVFNEKPTPTPAAASSEDEAQIDLTLNGSLYAGAFLAINLFIAGDMAGARALVKYGEEVEGSVSMQWLTDMREYNAGLYGEARLAIHSKVAVEGYWAMRKNLFWGDVEYRKIAEFARIYGEHELNLFPDFRQTMAVNSVPSPTEAELSIATKVENEIVHDVEAGFEIVNIETGEVLDSVYVETIKSDSPESIQGVSAEIPLPAAAKDLPIEQLCVRPVFHYAGHTISAAPTNVRKDMLFQPVVAWATTGAISAVSGYPFIGSIVDENTRYTVGNYLPILLRDTVFHKEPFSIFDGEYIYPEDEETLMGTWTGYVDGTSVTISLNEDGTGSYQESGSAVQTLVYSFNSPQSGDVRLDLSNGDVIIFTILSQDSTTVSIRFKNRFDGQTVVLNKN